MQTPSPPFEFDADFSAGLTEIFEEKIVFNKLLGLKITSLQPSHVSAQMAMRPELVGHYAYGRIHGGAISAGLDALGGLAVMAAIGARFAEEPALERLQRFDKVGTIDLRVDYLRAGIAPAGGVFVLRAEVLRLGSRVASTRMEFLSPDGVLLSAAAAAYIVS